MEFSVASKPKFCTSCGTPLEASDTSQAQGAVIEDDDDLEDAIGSSLDLSIEGLDFEFDVSLTQAKGQTIGSIMGTLDESQVSQPGDLPPRPKTSNENFKEEFKREAGSLKRNKTMEEDAQ